MPDGRGPRRGTPWTELTGHGAEIDAANMPGWYEATPLDRTHRLRILQDCLMEEVPVEAPPWTKLTGHDFAIKSGLWFILPEANPWIGLIVDGGC